MKNKKKILLVEDTETILRIYKTKLITEQFEVVTAKNGVEAIQAIAGQLFDAVLLDLMMPIVDGFKVLQVVKSDPRSAQIPIIVFSARGQPEEIEKAMKLGAEDYIVKSLTKPNDVVDKIRKILDSNSDQKSIKHYRIAVKEGIADAPSLSSEFGLNMFKCNKCGTTMQLDIIPDYSHQEPWFTGHFVCPDCNKSS